MRKKRTQHAHQGRWEEKEKESRHAHRGRVAQEVEHSSGCGDDHFGPGAQFRFLELRRKPTHHQREASVAVYPEPAAHAFTLCGELAGGAQHQCAGGLGAAGAVVQALEDGKEEGGRLACRGGGGGWLSVNGGVLPGDGWLNGGGGGGGGGVRVCVCGYVNGRAGVWCGRVNGVCVCVSAAHGGVRGFVDLGGASHAFSQAARCARVWGVGLGWGLGDGRRR
eukprot:scaffold5438_cov62-Isochrysis_galbana.AAC.1